MPRRRLLSSSIISVSRPRPVIVCDYSFAACLGLPRASSGSRSEIDVNRYLKSQREVLEKYPAWVQTFRAWVLLHQPTLISLSADTVLDSIVFPDSIAPQSYGFGIPDHVPALIKPNGSLNWFCFADGVLPRSIRGFYPLGHGGLACHSGNPSSAVPGLPGTHLAIDSELRRLSVFEDVRRSSRRRLETASDILLLGLEPTQLRESDIHLLKGLSAGRLTLVTRTPTAGGTLRNLCQLSGHCGLELGDLDSWITNRLTQWASV